MKKIFYLFLIFLISCKSDECKKNIEDAFDSKQMGECVYNQIKDNASSKLCYYSNLLYRLNNFRKDKKNLIKANAEWLLTENPKELFELYQIVGACKLTCVESFDVVYGMQYLLDEYKNGLYPHLFYAACLSDTEHWKNADISITDNKRVRDFLLKMKKIAEKRSTISSYTKWVE